MNRYIKKGILVTVAAFALTACSPGQVQFSPEQVVTKAVEESKRFSASFTESNLVTTLGNDGQQEKMVIREWNDHDHSRARVEVEGADGEKVISVRNKGKILTYTIGEDTAYEFDYQENNPLSQREQIERNLNLLQERSEIEIMGEDKLLGKDVYHIKATPKSENSIFGVEEYWIDQKNWLILKSIIRLADGTETELDVVEVDLDPKWDENMFEIDFGDKHVEIRDMADLDSTETVTLAEAQEILGQPFLQITDQDFQLGKIEYFELVDHHEVSMEYLRDGLLQFTVSMFKTPEDEEDFGLFGEEESVQLRGTIASYVNNQFITSLYWDEDGIRYSILVDNPALTLEEMKQLAESMELVE